MDNPGREYQDEMDKCIYGDIFLPDFLLLLLVDPEPVRAPEDPGDEERPPGQLDEGRDAQVGRAKIHGGHVEGGGGGAGSGPGGAKAFFLGELIGVRAIIVWACKK